jgi:hypothetical protein
LELLESLYEREFKNIGFVDRKVFVQDDKTLFIGCRRSGKTYIILDFLSKEKSALYIDFDDNRIDKKDIFAKLNGFIKSNDIKILVLENITEDDLYLISKIKNIDRLILSSRKDIKCTDDITKYHLYLLDFEEYIRFDSKNHNTPFLFSLFMKDSTYPEVVLSASENKKLDILQTNLLYISSDNTRQNIVSFIAENSGFKFSKLQIYDRLKKSCKISKDNLYSSLDELQNSSDIYFVSKIGQPKSAKKIFFADFKLKELFTYKKNVATLLEHMLFLELLKQNIDVEYIDNISFVSENIGYIAIAFYTPDFKSWIAQHSNHYKSYGIKEVIIISISDTTSEFELEDIKYRVYPFWIWSMFS